MRSARRTTTPSPPSSPADLSPLGSRERRAAGRALLRRAGRLPCREENAMPSSPLDDEHAPLYTVGQVAEMLAVKQAFLRRVDELRVVSPRRSPGGQRRYTRFEIRVIQQVVSMADEGITLQAIRRSIELERQLAEVTRQRDELARRLSGRS